jgi:hypothetical protein
MNDRSQFLIHSSAATAILLLSSEAAHASQLQSRLWHETAMPICNRQRLFDGVEQIMGEKRLFQYDRMWAKRPDPSGIAGHENMGNVARLADGIHCRDPTARPQAGIDNHEVGQTPRRFCNGERFGVCNAANDMAKTLDRFFKQQTDDSLVFDDQYAEYFIQATLPLRRALGGTSIAASCSAKAGSETTYPVATSSWSW